MPMDSINLFKESLYVCVCVCLGWGVIAKVRDKLCLEAKDDIRPLINLGSGI